MENVLALPLVHVSKLTKPPVVFLFPPTSLGTVVFLPQSQTLLFSTILSINSSDFVEIANSLSISSNIFTQEIKKNPSFLFFFVLSNFYLHINLHHSGPPQVSFSFFVFPLFPFNFLGIWWFQFWLRNEEPNMSVNSLSWLISLIN